MINALTIDVEDYYNVMARDWLGMDFPPTEAVVRNTNALMQILSDRDQKATFFLLGDVGRAFPGLIRDIVAAGHELGVHGFHHRQVFKLSRDEFAREAGDARKVLEDAAGAPIAGHRAPAFSIGPDTQWALEVLVELGFRYDSSVFPIRGRRYGWPGFPADIHEMTLPNGGRIVQAPMTAGKSRDLVNAWPAGETPGTMSTPSPPRSRTWSTPPASCPRRAT